MSRYETPDNFRTLIMSDTKSTDDIDLCYCLYRREIRSQARDAYAVEITSLFLGEFERAMFEDITSQEDRAREIFSLLSSNLVTPCTLSEILEDIL